MMTQKREQKLSTEAETIALGTKLGQILKAGDVITIAGPLGAGKTCLARAIIEAATTETDVTSPTFGLVQTYNAPKFMLYHFDLYRIKQVDEIWELGFEDALEEGTTLIEWPDRAAVHIPATALRIRLSVNGETRHAYLSYEPDWSDRLNTIISPTP